LYRENGNKLANLNIFVSATKRRLKQVSGVLSEEKPGAPPPSFSTDTPPRNSTPSRSVYSQKATGAGAKKMLQLWKKPNAPPYIFEASFSPPKIEICYCHKNA
jgi:hypothetical protein